MNFKYTSLLGLLILLFSFGIDKDNVFKKKHSSSYTYIPSGDLYLENEKSSIEGFHMVVNEVTNAEYRKFLAYLGHNNMVEEFQIAQIQNDGWELHRGTDASYLEPLKGNYATHPSYDHYPVVNITKEAATLYCTYLKETLNRDAMKNGFVVTEVRLPTLNEWIYAAKGGYNDAPYSWGSYYLRNAEGYVLANYNMIGTENIRTNYETGELEVVQNKDSYNSSYTAPSVSFLPNDYGLFNMCGNVAELIADSDKAAGGGWRSTGYDIQVTSQLPFEDYSCDVGFRPILMIKHP